MSHVSKYTYGLEKIEFAPILGDGGIGTTWTQYGLTAEDTFSMAEEDPTTTDQYVEESDTPVVSIVKEGKTTITFNVADPDIETMYNLKGGTISGSSPSRIWEKADTLPTIEMSVKISPKEGFTAIRIPRASVSAKLNSTLSKKTLLVIEVTCTVLVPTKSGTKSIYIDE